jgi:hypothetical protein
MVTSREVLVAVTVAPAVDRLQTVKELRVLPHMRADLCRMAVHPLWRTSIKAVTSQLDQRLQRGGKRVSNTILVPTLL